MVSLATTREKRYNAGNRMSRMLEEEQEDDFYKTTYGGFEEESDDNEYSSDDSVHDSPSSDSDISAPEDDEPISDDADDAPKRKMRVVTKAYTEPAKAKKSTVGSSSKTISKEKKPRSAQRDARRRSQQQMMEFDFDDEEDLKDASVRKSRRSTTVMKNTEFKMRMQEREVKAKQQKAMNARRPTQLVRRLTQGELLEEAKITEKQNLASLEMYHKLEAERKNKKVRKKTFVGPYIRYHSMSMPVVHQPVKPVQPVINSVQVVHQPGQPGVSDRPAIQILSAAVQSLTSNVQPVEATELSTTKVPPSHQRCTRNFITFSEEKYFQEAFPKKTIKTRSRQARHVCPVTRLTAKYLDPVTSIPFANKQAYKIIRDTYMPELEAQMEKNKKAKKKESTS